MYLKSQQNLTCIESLALIKECFEAVDLHEHKATNFLITIQDNELYLEQGYKSFEECCQAEFAPWGGYRRISQLIAATKVINAAGEFAPHIKNERQARSLARLASDPEKLKQAIALAIEESPNPTGATFRAAASKVVPLERRSKKVQEPMVPEGSKVRISLQSHFRCGEEGTVTTKPNSHTSIVEFCDGVLEAIADSDLLPPIAINRTRTQSEHDEAIAALEETHRKELERLEEQIMLRITTKTKEEAIATAQQELEASRAIAAKYKNEVIALQQKVAELQVLEELKEKNEELKKRISHLEELNKKSAESRWDTEKTIAAQKLQTKTDIKTLAKIKPSDIEPDAAVELLGLLGMALGNVVQSLPTVASTVLGGVALVLSCRPTKEAISDRIQELQSDPQIPSTQLSPFDLVQVKFLEKIRNKAALNNVTWEDVREVSNCDIKQLRRLAVLAKGEFQKELIKNIYVLLAQYIHRTKDREDFAWVSSTLIDKASEYLGVLQSQEFAPGDIVEITEESLPEYGSMWEVKEFDCGWIKCVSLTTNKQQTFSSKEVQKKSKLSLGSSQELKL